MGCVLNTEIAVTCNRNLDAFEPLRPTGSSTHRTVRHNALPADGLYMCTVRNRNIRCHNRCRGRCRRWFGIWSWFWLRFRSWFWDFLDQLSSKNHITGHAVITDLHIFRIYCLSIYKNRQSIIFRSKKILIACFQLDAMPVSFPAFKGSYLLILCKLCIFTLIGIPKSHRFETTIPLLLHFLPILICNPIIIRILTRQCCSCLRCFSRLMLKRYISYFNLLNFFWYCDTFHIHSINDYIVLSNLFICNQKGFSVNNDRCLFRKTNIPILTSNRYRIRICLSGFKFF